jgi:hypothetical protein
MVVTDYCQSIVSCNAETCSNYCQKNNYKNFQTFCIPAGTTLAAVAGCPVRMNRLLPPAEIRNGLLIVVAWWIDI